MEEGGDAGDNVLQAAHRINAPNGVRYFALTPDFIDDPRRLVWAPKRNCDRMVELDFGETVEYQWNSGRRELRGFLPREVRSAWAEFRQRQVGKGRGREASA